MRTRILVTILLLTLGSVGWVAAQGWVATQKSDSAEKPVWTLEVMHVRPEMFGPALNYLDEHWMLLRKEAKNQGVILSYRRFVEGTYPLPSASDRKSVYLLTEYKNLSAFADRDQIFTAIQQRLAVTRPGVLHEGHPEETYGPIDMTVLLEEPDNGGPQFKLLTRTK